MLNELMNQLFVSYQQLKSKRRKDEIEFVLNKPADVFSLSVNTDAVRLQQIISNLLDNAFKFTDKGRIELGYEIDQQDLVILLKTRVWVSKAVSMNWF